MKFKLAVVASLLLLLFASPLVRGSESVEDDLDEFSGDSETQSLRARHENARSTASVESDLDSAFDDDEFVLDPKAPTPSPVFKVKEVPVAAGQTIEQAELKMINLPDHFYMEAVFIAFLVAYGINYFFGKRTNENIVRAWANAYRSVFDEQFARLGSEGSLLIKESPSSFRMQCAGRANCAGVQCNLRLRRRHDLVSTIWEIFSPVEDVFDITVVLNDNAPPFVLAAGLNSQMRALKSTNKELESLAHSVTSPLDSGRFTVLADLKEVTTALLTEDVCKVIEKNTKIFRYLHFTDQYSESKEYKKVLRFRFKLALEFNEPNTIETCQTLCKMALYFIDAVAEKVHLSAASLEKSKKLRAKYVTEEQKEKQQELEEAKEQKRAEKRKLLEERMKTMSPEEREKTERKLERKELKRRQQKIKTLRG